MVGTDPVSSNVGDPAANNEAKLVVDAFLVELPTSLNASSFEQFLQLRYVTALQNSPALVGQKISITILRRGRVRLDQPLDVNRSFLLLIGSKKGGLQLRCSDDTAIEKVFDTFNATITDLGSFSQIAYQDPP